MCGILWSDVNVLLHLLIFFQELKADQEKLYDEIRALRERSRGAHVLSAPPQPPSLTGGSSATDRYEL